MVAIELRQESAPAIVDLMWIEEALERLAMTNFRRTPNLFTQTLELVHRSRIKGDA
jgi:hypothetical protein